MNAWKQGIKEAFKEIWEDKARQAELNWMNDYNNTDKWNKAIEKANSYS